VTSFLHAEACGSQSIADLGMRNAHCEIQTEFLIWIVFFSIRNPNLGTGPKGGSPQDKSAIRNNKETGPVDQVCENSIENPPPTPPSRWGTKRGKWYW
jgi:hypothetical protein